MSLEPRFFNDVPGADAVRRLIRENCQHLRFSGDNPQFCHLMLMGTSDLELTARHARPDERYRNHPTLEYQWPHIIVTPSAGLIESVRSSDYNARVIEAMPAYARVMVTDYTSNLPTSREGLPRVMHFEAVVDIYYARQ